MIMPSNIRYLQENETWDFQISDCSQDIVALGGSLTPEMLISAYREGVFPWYNEEDPIIWWSPDPRFVLYPEKFHVSGSLRKFLARNIREGTFRFTLDHAFAQVIQGCAQSYRPGQEGTWITQKMRESYLELHRLGYAHSVECWYEDRLAGGLYGVALGGCFYGESMFTRLSNASKSALVALVFWLREQGFGLIDCQQRTEHLSRFGAEPIPRKVFREQLKSFVFVSSKNGRWDKLWSDFPNSPAWRALCRSE